MTGLRIDRPCSEPWDAMPRTGAGRFCAACRREVVDLTRVTAVRAQAHAILFGASGLCARLLLDESGDAVFRPARTRDRSRRALPVVAAAASIAAGCGGSDQAAESPAACAPTVTIVALPGPERPHIAAPRTSSEPPDAAASAGPERPRIIIATAGDLHVMQHVHFAPGKATLQASSLPILDEVAKLLAENPDVRKVQIQGHTDDVEVRPNVLGQARADAAVAYLVKRGVDPARLEAKSFGATMPMEPPGTPEARTKNRRVSFSIQDP